jgi:predicted transcriptional regulator/GNAT superfamily N-acetyltransferase
MIHCDFLALSTLIDDVNFQRYADDSYHILSRLHDNYPNFKPWFYQSVVPGIRTGEREMILALKDNTILGIVILKNSLLEKKICTLYVSATHQKKGIGTRLFEESFAFLKTRKPLFSVPETHLKEFSSLLQRYDFKRFQILKDFYIKDQSEHVYNGFLQEVKMDVILSIQPRYAGKIRSGEKQYEFRKSLFKKPVRRIYIYESRPTQRIIGYFLLNQIHTGTPDAIWETCQAQAGIDEQAYFDYYKGKTQAYALSIDHFVHFQTYLDPKVCLPNFTPPQNYRYVSFGILEV